MQNGSLMRTPRRRGPSVWEYRWREPGPDGRRIHRRIVIGTADQFKSESAAIKAIVALRREINSNDLRLRARLLTLSELVEHYRRRELTLDNEWKTQATKTTYEGYLRKWIVPRWGRHTLSSIKPIEVECWLRNLRLSRASCAKIRNLMSVLFNHARRYDLFDRNPISLVRQSAKRRTVPEVLSVDEVQKLLAALTGREQTLVLLDLGTGLRMGELFGLNGRTSISKQTNSASFDRSSTKWSGHAKPKLRKSLFPSMPVWPRRFGPGDVAPNTSDRRTGFSPAR